MDQAGAGVSNYVVQVRRRWWTRLWHWLTRHRPNAQEHALARHVAVLEEQVTWLRQELARRDELVAQLRREGFNPPERPVEQPLPPVKPLPFTVQLAVERIAGKPGDPLWNPLMRQALEGMKRVDNGEMSEQDLVADLERGSDLRVW